ncbi:hypothetical protein D3C87_1319560 [compost metagenome]
MAQEGAKLRGPHRLDEHRQAGLACRRQRIAADVAGHDQRGQLGFVQRKAQVRDGLQAARLQAQPQVHHQRIGLEARLQARQRARHVARGADLRAPGGQQPLQRLQRTLVVIEHEHARGQCGGR